MTMVDTSQLSEVIDSLNQSTEDALSYESAEQFSRLEQELHEIEGYVRELQQAMWADEANATLQRLENGDPLTAVDKEVIRTFLVSDAEHYLVCENNYSDWIRELRRLMKDLAKRCHMIDRDSIADVRAVLKDAQRVVPDIRNYLEEKHRVERFDLAVDELDPQARNMLIRIVREQLYSPDR